MNLKPCLHAAEPKLRRILGPEGHALEPQELHEDGREAGLRRAVEHEHVHEGAQIDNLEHTHAHGVLETS